MPGNIWYVEVRQKEVCINPFEVMNDLSKRDLDVLKCFSSLTILWWWAVFGQIFAVHDGTEMPATLSIAFWLESIVLILGGGKINYIFWFSKDKNHMKKTYVSTPKIKKKIKRNTKKNCENTPQNWSKLAMAAACFPNFWKSFNKFLSRLYDCKNNDYNQYIDYGGFEINIRLIFGTTSINIWKPQINIYNQYPIKINNQYPTNNQSISFFL